MNTLAPRRRRRAGARVHVLEEIRSVERARMHQCREEQACRRLDTEHPRRTLGARALSIVSATGPREGACRPSRAGNIWAACAATSAAEPFHTARSGVRAMWSGGSRCRVALPWMRSTVSAGEIPTLAGRGSAVPGDAIVRQKCEPPALGQAEPPMAPAQLVASLAAMMQLARRDDVNGRFQPCADVNTG